MNGKKRGFFLVANIKMTLYAITISLSVFSRTMLSSNLLLWDLWFLIM